MKLEHEREVDKLIDQLARFIVDGYDINYAIGALEAEVNKLHDQKRKRSANG